MNNKSEVFWHVLALFLRGVFIGLVFGYASAFLYSVTAHSDEKVNEITLAILEYSAAHQIDPLLVAAVIKVESKFDPMAVGSSGEIGLMQLHKRYFADATFDVRQNISLGVRHLAWSRTHCAHKENNTWVICYNQGVNKAPKHPYKHDYYKKVMNEYEALKEARSPKQY